MGKMERTMPSAFAALAFDGECFGRFPTNVSSAFTLRIPSPVLLDISISPKPIRRRYQTCPPQLSFLFSDIFSIPTFQCCIFLDCISYAQLQHCLSCADARRRCLSIICCFRSAPRHSLGSMLLSRLGSQKPQYEADATSAGKHYGLPTTPSGAGDCIGCRARLWDDSCVSEGW